MEVLKAVVDSGFFNAIDLILFAIIGILMWFLTNKMRTSENYMNNTVEGMKELLEEERIQTDKLSKVVYEVRKEIEREREKNYSLREEVLQLKAENMRLQALVSQMESLVQQYKEELEKYIACEEK